MKTVITKLCLLVSFLINFLLNSYGQYVHGEPFAHTNSIIAYDPETGDMGIAVQSHWFSVGTSVAWGEAGVGIVATQSVVNFSFGPNGLALLKAGLNPEQVLDSLLKTDPGSEMRQVAIIDRKGNVAVRTGKTCVKYAGHIKGNNYSVQVNLGKDSTLAEFMANAFENSEGSLADKLLVSLEAAQTAGGDIRGSQSAALLIVRNKPTGKIWIDRKVDLRVDDHEAPLKELKRLYKVHSAYNAMNYGNDALMKGKLDNADEYYLKAYNLYPENGEILFWYAVELANMGKVEKALSYFKMVFAGNETWQKTLLPRIVEAGILNVKVEVLNKIKELK